MLRDTQTAVAASLLASDVVSPTEVITKAASTIRAGKLSAMRRLEIYRHNVTSNLIGALRDIYPVILAVVGDAFFLHAADQFVRLHPSRSGDLNRFGSELAGFLGSYPHATDLPYLADVARLEWAWHEAFHAGDTPPFDLARLAAIPAEEYGALRFKLHPTVRLVQSHFPILRIWQVNQPTFTGEMAVDWDAPSESLLIHRDTVDGASVLIERLSGAAYAFLHALARQAAFADAAACALDTEATFDLQGFLLESVQSGVIVDFIRK